MQGATREPWLASVESYRELAGRYAELGFTDLALHWPAIGAALRRRPGRLPGHPGGTSQLSAPMAEPVSSATSYESLS